jgi:glyoxylase-like metal-dependent hydrolase (beta-lactamase superfamily II)
MPMGVPKLLSIYVIENEGMRLMIDVGEALKARATIKKLKNLGIYPIHKIVLTHSHWDHAQGLSKIVDLMKDTDVEVLASVNAVENLRHPEKMVKGFEGINYFPFDGDISPLKEGDLIDLNGLELEIMNFFGHTPDSIGIFDKSKNNIFIGDAVSMRLDQDTFYSSLMPPKFNEKGLINSFNKLRNMRDRLESISLAHFGVWKEKHFKQILEEMEEQYFEVKNSLIEWYNEDPSIEVITKKYCQNLIPNSNWNETVFTFLVGMMINGLKISGYIE